MTILRRAITLAARRTVSEPVSEDAADAAQDGGETPPPLAMDASGRRDGAEKEELPAAAGD